MGTTQPIRNAAEVEQLKNYYYEKKPNLRNYTLICLGMNSALRISDLLELNWKDVYNFEKSCFLKHLSVTEHKTGKQTQIALNHSALEALKVYMDSIPAPKPTLRLLRRVSHSSPARRKASPRRA